MLLILKILILGYVILSMCRWFTLDYLGAIYELGLAIFFSIAGAYQSIIDKIEDIIDKEDKG